MYECIWASLLPWRKKGLGFTLTTSLQLCFPLLGLKQTQKFSNFAMTFTLQTRIYEKRHSISFHPKGKLFEYWYLVFLDLTKLYKHPLGSYPGHNPQTQSSVFTANPPHDIVIWAERSHSFTYCCQPWHISLGGSKPQNLTSASQSTLNSLIHWLPRGCNQTRKGLHDLKARLDATVFSHVSSCFCLLLTS